MILRYVLRRMTKPSRTLIYDGDGNLWGEMKYDHKKNETQIYGPPPSPPSPGFDLSTYEVAKISVSDHGGSGGILDLPAEQIVGGWIGGKFTSASEFRLAGGADIAPLVTQWFIGRTIPLTIVNSRDSSYNLVVKGQPGTSWYFQIPGGGGSTCLLTPGRSLTGRVRLSWNEEDGYIQTFVVEQLGQIDSLE